jgi:hypothetical protein
LLADSNAEARIAAVDVTIPRFSTTRNNVIAHRTANLAAEHVAEFPAASLPLCAAISLLRQACQLAESAACDAWDFAIELDELRRLGVTIGEVRWLMARGLALQAGELTTSGDGRRRFDAASPLSVRSNSCFVITDAGLTMARRLADGAIAPLSDDPSSADRRNDPNRVRIAVPRDGSIAAPRPIYDDCRNEFFLGGQLVKRFRSPAPNQQTVLAAFQSLAWPNRIEDPLPPSGELCPRRRLSETIRALNRRQLQYVVRFCGDGSGRGVLWERVG